MLKEDRVKEALITLYDRLKLADNSEDYPLLNETTLSQLMFKSFEENRVNLKGYLGLDYIEPTKFNLPSDKVMEYGTEVFNSDRTMFLRWLYKYNNYWGKKPVDCEEKEIMRLLDNIEYGSFS